MPEPNTRDGNKVSGAHCILLPWGLSSSSQAHPNATKETGWSGIEDYMGEDDKSQMKVLNEDIDALLIFVRRCNLTLAGTNYTSLGWSVLCCTYSIRCVVLSITPARQ